MTAPLKQRTTMAPHPNRQLSNSLLTRLLRMHTALIVPFAFQMILIVGLVGYFSFHSGQRAVLDLATQVRQELSARIEGELRSYFDVPFRLLQINSAALINGAISFTTESNVSLFQQQVLTYPFLTGAYCANEQGEHTDVIRSSDDPTVVLNSVVNETTNQFRYVYALDRQGNRTKLLEKGDRLFDPRQRPWYQAAAQAGGPTWSPVYLDFITGLPTLSPGKPVYHPQTGALLGVCAVDLILPTQVRQFLASLTIGKQGRAFVINRTGAVLASSGAEPLTVGEGEDLQMLLATESSEALIRESARFLAAEPGGLAGIDKPQQLDFMLDGERQFVQVTPFRDRYGLDWLIVITVPEKDFMEGINANTRMTILLCLAALLLALLIGILMARGITRPVLRIANASEALAAGDLDQRVPPNPVVELDRLSNAFNSMAQQLRAAFASIQASEKKFRSLYEDSKDAIFIAQADGALLDMNPAGLQLFGLRDTEVTTTNVGAFFAHADHWLKFREAVAAQAAVSDFEVQLQKEDGTLFDALITATLRSDERGAPAGYQGIVRDITVQKQNERLRAENLRMGAELDISRRLQRMILPTPEELGQVEGLEIATYMEPAAEVGGDYYDVLRQNGTVKIGIGDVTDHGLESGVVMLMTQTAVRTLLNSGESDPVRFLDVLNRTIYENVQRMQTDRNLTLSLIDYTHGTLRLSGQHEEMIVVRRDGVVENVDTGGLGFPIGLADDIADLIHHTTVELAPGDGIVLYTDGVTEAENAAGEQYGLERLCATARRHWNRSVAEIKEAIIADVRQHIGQHVVYDDITLVVVKQN
jgi:sigma-B regulation protein RsbU (phosphoserine phosphatase)